MFSCRFSFTGRSCGLLLFSGCLWFLIFAPSGYKVLVFPFDPFFQKCLNHVNITVRVCLLSFLRAGSELHLSFYQGKNLLTSSYITLVHSSQVYTSSNNSSWSVNTPAICIIYVMKSNWREILKPCSLQEVKWWLSWPLSSFRKMLMLQHLKRSRRNRMVLLQIALKNTRRARRAWPGVRAGCVVAFSNKRSDSGERCKVKKAMKSIWTPGTG